MKKIMFFRKLMIIIFLMVGALSISFTINAEEVVLVDSNGDPITHYGSNDPVYINAEYDLKDTEFRACWVSPLVGDISYFSSEENYKKEMIKVFDNMEAYGLNVIVFHIRIMNDAFYESKYNDWSVYYNTNPSWEALPWIIEEAHRRGIEFHAWMNPYRVSNDTTQTLEECAASFPASNMARISEYLLKGTNSIILNPGEPSVRNWLVKVCMEVVENYDVDAIHFDDYFYDAGIDDTATRNKYNTTNMSIGDWRRKQVSDFIEALSANIRSYNEANNCRVQLGVSPSGVYRAGNGVVTYNSDGDAITNGSLTASASFQHYDNYLYSDTLKWINEEWIDYIIPQTYWAINHPSCPYADLMEWWNAVVKNKDVKLYSGLGIYLQSSTVGYSWYTDENEAYNQIMICNGFDNVDGVCFFKYSNIASALRNPSVTQGVSEIWTIPPILPEITTMDTLEIDDVTNLDIVKNTAGYKLTFDANSDAKFYVLYRSTNPITFSSSEVYDVFGDLSYEGVVSYTDTTAEEDVKYYYGIKAQSYSNTLSQNGETISTENAEEGDLCNLGNMEDVFLSGELQVGKTISILFKSFFYPFGTAINYQMTYNFDNSDPKTITTFTSKKGYNAVDVVAPSDAKSLTVTLTASNNLGSTTQTQVFYVVEGLPDITNFGVLNDYLYAYESATFVWNNLYIDDVTYIIQYSTDTINWTDLKTVNTTSQKFNIKQKATLQTEKGEFYYRVIVTKDDMIGYSNVAKYTVYRSLGNFDTLTINGEVPQEYYSLTENDDIVFYWKKHNASSDVSYTIMVSFDNNTWYNLTVYTKNSSFVTGSDGYITETIPVSYSKYKVYIQITGISTESRVYSEVYEFYVTLSFICPDEACKALYENMRGTISELGIFN